MPVVEFVLFSNLVIKFIVISCHNSSDNGIIFFKLYFACVECLFR